MGALGAVRQGAGIGQTPACVGVTEVSRVERQPTSPGLWTVVDAISVLVILGALVVDISDLLGYLSRPGDYPVGAEAAGLRYASRVNFLGATIGAIVLHLVGLIAPMYTKISAKRRAIRFAVALWAVIATAWFMLTGEQF